MARRSRASGSARKGRGSKAAKRKIPTKNPRRKRSSLAELREQLERRTNELNEAREQQTATSEVLQVISSSTGDVAPVFQKLLENATRVCGAEFGTMTLLEDGQVRNVALHNVPPAYATARANRRVYQPHPESALGKSIRTRQVVQIDDLRTNPAYLEGNPSIVELADVGGARTLVVVPMQRDDEMIGAIVIYRQEIRPFADKQVELLKSFASQAVIAIENARLLTETREALERQTATAEVLQVINRSPGNLVPVFDAILDRAHSLCGVAQGSLQLYDGGKFRAVAVQGLSDAFADRLRQGFSPDTLGQRLLDGAHFVHISDLSEIDDPMARAAVELSGIRTVLFIPLRKDGALLGRISASRREVKPFTEKEITLLESFAEQAVIAMENARLLSEIRHRNDELAEALEFQTATGEVLRIVAGSPDHLQPVFDAMLEKAIALCNAKFGTLFLYDGKAFAVVADRNLPPAFAQVVRGQSFSPEANTGFRRLVESMAALHVRDLSADPTYAEREPLRTAAIELGGVRSLLAIQLLKKGELIGNFSIYGEDAGGFAENQIALVTTFADQAVIAIENARLLGELRERTSELARSVDELTATSDVLKVISRSTVELKTVLDTLVETAARICHADQAYMFRRHADGLHHMIAVHGASEEGKASVRDHPIAADRGTTTGRVALERRPIHIPDVLADPDFTYTEAQHAAGFRTVLGLPLLREDTLIGVFAVGRNRVDPFTDKEIELATTFADQAVIAIENARLFEELRERQAELRVTFDNMGDGVVMFGADTRLVAWNRNFQTILDLPDELVAQRPTYVDYVRILAERGEFGTDDLEGELHRRLQDTDRELRLERTRPDGRVIEVRRSKVPGGGFVLIYGDITERKRAEQTIRAARDAAETALRELQAAQASLVHAQKMAALGQLTAGIAHEIKNPLNFVNNFAGVSVELLEELKGATAEAIGALDSGKRTEILETIGMLTGNLKKIAEHGRRADGIVRGMLQHSRGSSGDWQTTDLNTLVEESSNLAYHGARAQDQDFKVALELDLDRNLAPIEVVSQDVSRVLLNLISNGFYAVAKRGREDGVTFSPLLRIATHEYGEGVEIRVRDNGVGIPPEHCEKLFQPFFTTKPTGEGTGLGLSISYEIITQQHGGTIEVDSEFGGFTEFTVRLPRRRHAVASRN